MSSIMVNFWFFLIPASTSFLIVKENILGLREQSLSIILSMLHFMQMSLVCDITDYYDFISMLNTVVTKYSVLK